MQDRTNLPVLLVAFKRPDTTRKVVEAIRGARPPRVYFAVDGPRPDKPGEAEAVNEVRELLVEAADWDCQVETLFRDENLGCARGVSEAISWFFEREEAGVILEDDCVPHPAFFTYCENLLERYADEPGVMHISGHSRAGIEEPGGSYFMSRYPQVWGWATWRDAWERFRMDRNDLEEEMARVIGLFPTARERQYWEPVLRRTFEGRIDSWAYRWAFAIWEADGVSAYPARNLVDNVGFGTESTHTGTWSDSRWSQRPAEAMETKDHPASIRAREDLDTEIFDQVYAKPILPIRLFRIARTMAVSPFARSRST